MNSIYTVSQPGKEPIHLPASIKPALFKYFPPISATKFSEENLINLFSKNILRATGCGEVNDPMDCNPAFTHNLTIKNFRQFIKKILTEETRNEAHDKYKVMLQAQFPKETSFKKILRVPSKYNYMIEDVINSNLKKLGFISFTEESSSTLMWAHYADSHQGICVEFKTRSSGNFLTPIDVPIACSCIEMEYSLSRPTIETNSNYPNTNADALQNCLLTKSKDWEYEKEWRYMTRAGSNGCLHKVGDLIEIGNDSISAVIFGIKTSNCTKDFILKSFNNKHQNIKFYQTYLCPKTYALKKIEISVCL